MESPSAQFVLYDDADFIETNGPPSSPFLNDTGSASNCPEALRPYNTIDGHQDLQISPIKPALARIDNKENSGPENKVEVTTKFQTRLSPETTQRCESSMSLHHSTITTPLDAVSRLRPERSPLTPRGVSVESPQRSGRINTSEKHTKTPAAKKPHFSLQSDKMASRSPTVQEQENNTTVDDTCLSAFSEIPDVVTLMNVNDSPSKHSCAVGTPGSYNTKNSGMSRKRPSPSRSQSPTPRRLKTPRTSSDDENTSFLIDFTQQMDGISDGRLRSARTESGLLQHLNRQRSPQKSDRQSWMTPSRKSNSILNLLDFELPPAPTPRSIPTITVREMESLKASYLSQISSLQASLSGRVAEVESLKRAISDTERRAAETMEHLREEKCKAEQAEEEKAGWERRGLEMENLINSIKEEIVKSEVEKDDLIHQVDRSQERLAKTERELADAIAGHISNREGDDVDVQVQKLVAIQIDAKIEAVSRELHTVYKEKHERKVATLKKSYEARSEKKCADLQSRVDELERQNDELLANKDATFSGTILTPATINDTDIKARYEEEKASVARLERELVTFRQQQEQLIRELQQERTEKGDLVAAVDEMLALQPDNGPTQQAISVVEDFRKSLGRQSGLKPPSASSISESRLGKNNGMPRGLAVPSSGKSKMLANIERMARSGNTAT